MSDKNCHYQYTVRRGDSFYLIAHRLGVPLRDLLDANSEINPARLTVGDVLCIPAAQEEKEQPTPQPEAPVPPAEQPPAPEPQPIVSDVQTPPTPAAEEDPPAEAPDDLLDHPAVDEPPAPQAEAPAAQPAPDADTHMVAKDETLADIQLAAGLNLHTLQTANPNTDLEHLTPGQLLRVPQENVPCPTAQTYTLRAGDTLESAALMFNVSVGALLRANPCLAPGDFVPGMCILVPDV